MGMTWGQQGQHGVETMETTAMGVWRPHGDLVGNMGMTGTM